MSEVVAEPSVAAPSLDFAHNALLLDIDGTLLEIALTPEQDAAMRKAMEPVYKDVANRVGQPLIDEFLKETRGETN